MPDSLHGVLLKEDIAPDAVFNIEPATGDGQMNVRVLVELSTVRMEGAEDIDLQALFACPPEHSPGGSPGQDIKQGPLSLNKGHSRNDMLPVVVGKDVALLRYPLLGGFEAAGAAGF